MNERKGRKNLSHTAHLPVAVRINPNFNRSRCVAVQCLQHSKISGAEHFAKLQATSIPLPKLKHANASSSLNACHATYRAWKNLKYLLPEMEKKRRAVSKAYQKHGFHPKRSCDFVDHVQTNSGGVVAGLLLVVGQKHDSQSGTNHSTSLVP